MFFENADIIKYNNNKYVVVSVHKDKVMNKVFALACLLDNEEPTDDLAIFFGTIEEPHLVMDEVLINRLMPVLQEQLKNDIKDLF